jgi:hypothetical protein
MYSSYGLGLALPSLHRGFYLNNSSRALDKYAIRSTASSQLCLRSMLPGAPHHILRTAQKGTPSASSTRLAPADTWRRVARLASTEPPASSIDIKVSVSLALHLAASNESFPHRSTALKRHCLSSDDCHKNKDRTSAKSTLGIQKRAWCRAASRA